MALPPMGSSADQHSAAQESMFEDEPGYPELEAYEASYEVSEDPSFEPSGEFPEDASMSLSAHALEDPVHEPGAGAAGTVAAAKGDPESMDELTSAPAPNHSDAAETESMTVLTVDDFAALEERILRAVSLVRRERQARVAAEERVAALEVELHAQRPAIERMKQEVDSLRAEREQVRQRVERLLGQLDAMEL